VLVADDSDEDAVFLTWAQSCPQTGPTVVPALPVFTGCGPPAFAVLSSVIVTAPRSHDPPCRPSSRPRSPPPLKPLLAV
jgi:hypothetical protein